jgi:hypothetical protein
MKEKLTEHIRLLFADAERRSPDNRQLAELKEELLLNTLEKYDHMLETGRTPEAAYALAVSGIGDIEGLMNDVIGEAPASEKACEAVPAVESATPAHQTEGTCADGDLNEVSNEDNGEDNNEDNDEDGDEDGGKKRPPRSRRYALVNRIIWTVTLGAYFALSFATHAWQTTWLLFIMGIAADNVAEGIFDLRR